jgi:hypothetical protein
MDINQSRSVSLDDAVPVLTGDPMATVESIVQESTERETLEQLTDGELLRRTAREVLIAVYVVANAIVRRGAVLVTKPAERSLCA